MANIYETRFLSPIGLIIIRGNASGIASLDFVKKEPVRSGAAQLARDTPQVLRDCLTQLDEYFRGERTSFSVPLNLPGTPFQKKVWKALLRIPYGETVTYKDIASAIGNARATRAVGGANHRNPVSIIVPCHRVVGSDGRLTGYGGGLDKKAWLLAHERQHARD
jgi:methylated-DNA-[protein]-cysteine S-methyltransferase